MSDDVYTLEPFLGADGKYRAISSNDKILSFSLGIEETNAQILVLKKQIEQLQECVKQNCIERENSNGCEGCCHNRDNYER